jgi:hypothetical protein
MFDAIKQSIPQEMRLVQWREVDETFAELSEELKKRQADEGANYPATYVIVFGLQRYRQLRKSEDSFSFSAGDDDKPPTPDKVFATLLKDGAPVGMHVIAWADTPVSVDRTLDRAMMREFDHRILFQMSAADSSNLIDSPAANKLGFFRALAFSEEQGSMEKFRPYAVPNKQWLQTVKQQLGRD